MTSMVIGGNAVRSHGLTEKYFLLFENERGGECDE